MINQDRPDVQRFYRDYSWQDYVTTWSDNLVEYGIDLATACRTIELPERHVWPAMQTAWWEIDRLDGAADAVLHYLRVGAWSDHRNDLGWMSKGELETAVALHRVSGRTDEMCALLTLASNFHHVDGRNRRYGEWIAHPVVLQRLEIECRDRLRDAGVVAPWRHYHSSVLPAALELTGVSASDANGYAALVAAEHAMTLTRFASVRFLSPVEPQAKIDKDE